MATDDPYTLALNKFLHTDFRAAAEGEILTVCNELSDAIYMDVDKCTKRSVTENFLTHITQLLDVVIEKHSIALFSCALYPLEKFLVFTKRDDSLSAWYANILSRMLAFLPSVHGDVTLYMITLQNALHRIRVGFPIAPCSMDSVLSLESPEDVHSAELAQDIATQLLTHTVPTIQELRLCLPRLMDRIRGRTAASAEVCLAVAAIGYQALKGPKETTEEMAGFGVVEELVRLIQYASTRDRLPAYSGSVLRTLCLLARRGPPIIDRIIACKALDTVNEFIFIDNPYIRKNASMIVSYILGYTGLFSPLVTVTSQVPYPSAMLLSCDEIECDAVRLLMETFLSCPDWEPWFTENRLFNDSKLLKDRTEEAKKAYSKCLQEALARIPDTEQRRKVQRKLAQFGKRPVVHQVDPTALLHSANTSTPNSKR